MDNFEPLSYGGIPKPFSLRLSFEERVELERLAGDMALGEFIRNKVFDNSPSGGPAPGPGGFKPQRRRKASRKKAPIKDHAALAQLLGELGKARLANNLNQLAKAVNSGSLPVSSDVEKAILHACEEIRWMRKILIQALGLRQE